MSYTICIIAENHSETYAEFSNTGLSEFRLAVESGDYPTLQHLIDQGWEDDLPKMTKELKSLRTSAKRYLKASIDEVLSAIKESGLKEATIILSNGQANE